MPEEKVTYTSHSEDDERIDRIVARLTQFPRSRVRGLMLHGGVSINHTITLEAGTPVSSGDLVTITYDKNRKYRSEKARSAYTEPGLSFDLEQAGKGRGKDYKARGVLKFQVLHQDDALVVVNKEAGLLTVATDRRESQNLLDLLSTLIHPNRRSKLGLVHRLDRDTSGLLVFGQDRGAAESLIAQFAARKPTRIYAALVKGILKDKEGTIRSHLKTDKALNQRSQSNGRGELAITHYEVLETFKDATLIQVRLETGRRNQIRAHFAEMGHPILGDQRYQVARAQHPAWPHLRLALHARSLGFEHPLTGKTMHFESDLPEEFLRFQASQRPKLTSSQTNQV
jgi:23S rRNA pseudouridine1911/1915/1917 synthase